MSWSFSEIRFLSVKAAKGSGLPWGLAEEAGFAVEWLERNGEPGVDALAAYLEESNVNSSLAADQCPITQGSWISDVSGIEPSSDLMVFQPLLLVPFLSSTCGEDQFALKWEGNSVSFSCAGILTSAGKMICDELVDVTLNLATSDHNVREAAIRVPAERKNSIKTLARFAAKTYAPATEASRLAGAGAGTSDND